MSDILDSLVTPPAPAVMPNYGADSIQVLEGFGIKGLRPAFLSPSILRMRSVMIAGIRKQNKPIASTSLLTQKARVKDPPAFLFQLGRPLRKTTQPL